MSVIRTEIGWAVVELMGRHEAAGLLSREYHGNEAGGVTLLRVDFPEIDGITAHHKLFGQGAIFAIHPCTEEAVRQRYTPLGAKYSPYMRPVLAAAAADADDLPF